NVADTGVRMRAQQQGGLQRSGHDRNASEVAWRTGDMGDGAVVAHGSVDRAANSARNFVHSASTRIGSANDVSSWKRRNSPPAARKRYAPPPRWSAIGVKSRASKASLSASH